METKGQPKLPQVAETNAPPQTDAFGERLLYDETSRNVQMYIHWFVGYKFGTGGVSGIIADAVSTTTSRSKEFLKSEDASIN